MKRTLQTLALAACLFSQSGFLQGQDKQLKSDLAAGLSKLAQRDVALVGAVEEIAPEFPGMPGGGVLVLPENGSTEFQGDFEVLAAKNGDLVLVSKDELPGIKIYKHEEDVMCVQAYTAEPIQTSLLVKNVAKLADWKALSAAVAASSEIRAAGKGKITEVRVVLGNDFMPGDSFPAIPLGVGGDVPNDVTIRVAGGPMIPAVTELVVTFNLNAAKEIVGVTYELQYDHPLRGMIAAVNGQGAFFQVIGNALPVDGALPVDEAVEVNRAVNVNEEEAAPVVGLGKKLIYDFDVTANPSKKATEFSEQAKTMLKNRK